MDSAIYTKVLKPSQKNRARGIQVPLLKKLGSTLRVMGLSPGPLPSMLMVEVLAVFETQPSKELRNEFSLKHNSGTALVGE